MHCLFWDIDGTLLTTGRAGVFAWEDAAREVLGVEVDFAALDTAGLTDIEIGATILRTYGRQPDLAAVARIVGLYEDYLPRSLPRRQGRVLPNVREILDALQDRRDVRSYLLTGNTRGGARAKLTHYELVDYFPDGAFAEDTSDRRAIAARALALARDAGPVNEDAVFVVGDTPHDIDCGHAIGARTVAVATGGYALDELESHRPWRAFAELPSADAFVRLIEEARAGLAGRTRPA
jgi:phosphoglycolate phosphatase-like HAD superfamily hydrolase